MHRSREDLRLLIETSNAALAANPDKNGSPVARLVEMIRDCAEDAAGALDRCFVFAARIDEQAKRIDELLETIVKLSRSVPYEDERNNVATLVAEVGTLRARVAELEREQASLDCKVPPKHAAYVEPVESIDGTTRKATCMCGWSGPKRPSLMLAVDDAAEHELDDRLGRLGPGAKPRH